MIATAQSTLKLDLTELSQTGHQKSPEASLRSSEGCLEGPPIAEDEPTLAGSSRLSQEQEPAGSSQVLQECAGPSTPKQATQPGKPVTGGKITKKKWDHQRPIWNEATRPDLSWAQPWPYPRSDKGPGRATAGSFSYADAGGTIVAGRSCSLTLKSIQSRVKPGVEGVKQAGDSFAIDCDPLVDTVYDVMVAFEKARGVPKENIILYGPKFGYSLQPRVPLIETGLFWRQDGEIRTAKKHEERFLWWKLGQTFY